MTRPGGRLRQSAKTTCVALVSFMCGWVALAAHRAAPAFAGVRAAPSGNQDQRPPIFRGVANFVYVDVYPRRDGHLVEGLRAEDFQVLEDGKPQKVETFEFIRIEPNAPVGERRDPNTKEDGDQQAADPRNRVFVVYLDLYHTTFFGAHETRAPLLDFLNRTIGASDLFGVLTPEVPVSQLVFARKTDTLEYELTKNFDWSLGDKKISPLGRPPIEWELEYCSRGDAPDLGDALVALHREDLLASSLEELMRHLRDLRDERKNVLLISEGWSPRGPATGLTRQGTGLIPRIGPGPSGRLGVGVPKQGEITNESWCNQQIARLSSIDFEQRFRDLLTLANRANVSFYPVDVGGLRVNSPIADASRSAAPSPQAVFGALNAGRARIDTLKELAENTDGHAVVDSNDLNAGFRRIADELSAYYLIGYSSTNSNQDGKFRRIEVKTRQPQITIAARRGYLAASADVRATPAAATPGVPAGVTDELGRLARLRSDAELFGYGVVSGTSLDVVAEIAGQQIERGHFRKGGDVRATLARPSAEPVVVNGRIDPDSRGALLHIPLDGRDTGPWRVTLQVSGDESPFEERIEIAPATSSLLSAPLCFRGTASARVPLHPVADFQFRRTERLHAEWPIAGPLDQRIARVLDRRGQPLALGAAATEQQSGGRTVVAVDLTLSPLGEGDYLIEIVAGRGTETDRRLLAFRIVR